MGVDRMPEGDDDISDLIGDVEEGLTPPVPPEQGKDPTPKDDASGTPDVDRDDDSDDGDEDPRWKVERKAKKALERKLQKQAREMAALREDARRQSELLKALTAAELERRTGSVASQVEAAELRLERAIDEGNAKEQILAQTALAEAREAERAARDLVRRTKEAPPPPVQADDDDGPDLNDHASEWAEKHSSWFDPSGKDKDSRAVINASAYVAETMGIPGDDPKHFAALEKLLTVSIPHRFKGGGSVERDLPATAGSSRAGGTSDARTPADLQGIVLTKADIALYSGSHMGPDRLDPRKPEDVIQMKRYKAETLKRKADRSRG